MRGHHKTHHTAVVVIPPAPLWEPIQAIRRRYDRQIHRWMPHINLLYPFLPREQFARALPRLTEACASLAPFRVTLATFDAFTHARGTATLWLVPEPREAIVRLQATLQARFPDYDEQSRFPGGFTPHLSVGQVRSPAARDRLLRALRESRQPLQFCLTAIALIWREGTGPFRVYARVPLGASSAYQDA